MPEKRKKSPLLEDEEDGSDISPYAKRSRPSPKDGPYNDDDNELDELESLPRTNGKSGSYERPRNDPIYGMRSAFPGLDNGPVDELVYGPPDDGIEYLRMVRSEANSLPTLFVAPKNIADTKVVVAETNTIDNDGEKEQRLSQSEQQEELEQDLERAGYYVDGVYIAKSTGLGVSDQNETEEEAEDDIQPTYFNLLLHRFLLLRSTLKCTPPAAAIAALDRAHPISLPYRVKEARLEWRRLLLGVDPLMVQLACMEMESVFGVLRIVGKLVSEGQTTRRTGAWAWGLLGRCRDVGQLGSEEVSELRDLGKRAAKVLKKLRDKTNTVNYDNDRYPEGKDGKVDDDRENEGVQAEAAEDDYEPPEALAAAAEANPTTDEPPVAASVPSGVSRPPPIAMDVSDNPPLFSEPTISNTEDLEAAKVRLKARLLLDEGAFPSTLPSTFEECKPAVEQQEQPFAKHTLDPNTGDDDDDDNDVDERIGECRAMLSMIITIVGEFYGQRDLLDARDTWVQDDNTNVKGVSSQLVGRLIHP